MTGDADLFETYKNRFQAAADPVERQRFLAAMTKFEQVDLINRLLAYTLSGQVRTNEIVSVLFRLSRKEENRDLLLSWIADNYTVLAERVPTERLGNFPYVAGGCSWERVERARTVFSSPSHQVAGTQISLDATAAQVASCITLRRREAGNAARYLANLQVQ